MELDLSVLDDAGRILLDADARTRLTAMGWQRRRQTLVRVLPDGGSAAEAVTRVLIEVLGVAHPADLDWRVMLHG